MKRILSVSTLGSFFLVSCSMPAISNTGGEIYSAVRNENSVNIVESRKFKCGSNREVEISKTQEKDIYLVLLKNKTGLQLFNEKAKLVSSNVTAGIEVLEEIDKNMRFVNLEGQVSGARIEFVSGLVPSGWFNYELQTSLFINNDDDLQTHDCVLQPASTKL